MLTPKHNNDFDTNKHLKEKHLTYLISGIHYNGSNETPVILLT